VLLPLASKDVFHPVLQLQLAFLEGDFFELFGFGEVKLLGEFVQASFELVMLNCKPVKFLVGLQKVFLELLRLLIHAAPPLSDDEWVLTERWDAEAACD
jgi:hypothetical protein